MKSLFTTSLFSLAALGAFEAAEASVGGEAPAPAKKSAPSVEKVTMSDSRVIEFVGKRKLLKESLIEEGQPPKVRLDFRNGETRIFEVPASLLARFAAHGAEQKLGDETAGEEDVDDMVLAVDALIERLNKGEWSIKREGGGMSGTSVLIKALMELSGKDLEHVKKFLSDKTQADKMALRNSPQLKPIVDRLEAEKVAKAAKVDTNALLAAL